MTTVIVTKSFFGVEDGKIYPRTIEVGDTLVGDLAEVALREKNAITPEEAEGLSIEELTALGNNPHEAVVEVDSAGAVEIPTNWRTKKWFALRALASKIMGHDPAGANEARDIIANEEDRQARDRRQKEEAEATARAIAAANAPGPVVDTSVDTTGGGTPPVQILEGEVITGTVVDPTVVDTAVVENSTQAPALVPLIPVEAVTTETTGESTGETNEIDGKSTAETQTTVVEPVITTTEETTETLPVTETRAETRARVKEEKADAAEATKAAEETKAQEDAAAEETTEKTPPASEDEKAS